MVFKTGERDPIAAAMRQYGKTRLEVLEGILEAFNRHPAVLAANPRSNEALISLLAAIEIEKNKKKTKK